MADKKSYKNTYPCYGFIFIAGNIICYFVKEPVKIPTDAVLKKNGFLLFKDANTYITILKQYPHNPGVTLTIYTMREGESYWDVIQL